MHKRVIFQDIDGVLNNLPFLMAENDSEAMDPINVARMRSVVVKTGASLVISSAWRHGWNWEERIRGAAVRAGWSGMPIIGRTGESHSRGEEIRLWLAENPTEDFVIVDDNIDDMLPDQASHVVECDETVGFSEANRQWIEQRWA